MKAFSSKTLHCGTVWISDKSCDTILSKVNTIQRLLMGEEVDLYFCFLFPRFLLFGRMSLVLTVLSKIIKANKQNIIERAIMATFSISGRIIAHFYMIVGWTHTKTDWCASC